MTGPRLAPPCPFMESALASATAQSRARNCEMQVVQGADGGYRVLAADAAPAAGETLIAMVGAEGETLIYALRMVA